MAGDPAAPQEHRQRAGHRTVSLIRRAGGQRTPAVMYHGTLGPAWTLQRDGGLLYASNSRAVAEAFALHRQDHPHPGMSLTAEPYIYTLAARRAPVLKEFSFRSPPWEILREMPRGSSGYQGVVVRGRYREYLDPDMEDALHDPDALGEPGWGAGDEYMFWDVRELHVIAVHPVRLRGER